MSVRAVVFDLFDTLVDLRGEDLALEEYRGQRIPASARAAHALAFERHGVDFDAFHRAMMEGNKALHESHLARDREVTTLLRFTDALARLGIEDAELAERMSLVHMGVIKSVVSAPAHHASVLDALRKRVRVGVCSNFSHSETAHQILREAGYDAHLDAIVVSDAFGLRKPRQEIFLETLAQLGVAPEEALHVGDSLRADVGGAAGAGIRSVWITRRVRDPERLLREHAGPPPDHRVADLAELASLLDALAG